MAGLKEVKANTIYEMSQAEKEQYLGTVNLEIMEQVKKTWKIAFDWEI